MSGVADATDIALLAACGRNDTREVEAQLRRGANPEGPPLDRFTPSTAWPLMISSRLGALPIVKALVEASADIHRVADNGMTAVVSACGWGHTAVVEYLLTKNPSLEVMREGRKVHVFDIARGQRHHGVMKSLLAHEFGLVAGGAKDHVNTNRVEIIGLVSQPTLNGMHGVIIGPEDGGRVPVLLDNGRAIKVRSQCIVRCGKDLKALDPNAPDLIDRFRGEEKDLLACVATHLPLYALGALRCAGMPYASLVSFPPLMAPAFGLSSYPSYLVGMTIKSVRVPGHPAGLHFDASAEADFQRYHFSGNSLLTACGEFINTMKDEPAQLILRGLDWPDAIGKRIIAVEHHTFSDAGVPILGGGPCASTGTVIFLGGGGMIFAVGCHANEFDPKDVNFGIDFDAVVKVQDEMKHRSAEPANDHAKEALDAEAPTDGVAQESTDLSKRLYKPGAFEQLVAEGKLSNEQMKDDIFRYLDEKDTFKSPSVIYTTSDDGEYPGAVYYPDKPVGPDATTLEDAQRDRARVMAKQFKEAQRASGKEGNVSFSFLGGGSDGAPFFFTDGNDV